jgi:mannosyltransferase OCH1-like enzyme
MNEAKKELIAEEDNSRSRFIYNFLQKPQQKFIKTNDVNIPKVIVQYWHSLNEIPKDVLECIESWKVLENKGFQFKLFDDHSAKEFINKHFDEEHLNSYLKCHHPAMRCDYFRLCYLYICGGFYVDSDELLLNEDIDHLFNNNNIKVQPFCYSIKQEKMIEKDFFLKEPYDATKIYYFNNNPVIAPPHHDLISLALKRATSKLIREENIFDIQSTTGPGNLSASLVYYLLSGKNEVENIDDWNSISKSPWPLSYRNDDRNWRLYNGNKKKWFEN